MRELEGAAHEGREFGVDGERARGGGGEVGGWEGDAEGSVSRLVESSTRRSRKHIVQAAGEI